jgi:hypothetical protein
VALSACNTAAGDKPGAEALSGLARAFFYAGARALLISRLDWRGAGAYNEGVRGGWLLQLSAKALKNHRASVYLVLEGELA